MFTCRGKAMEHDERGWAEGAVRGEREADDMTRGGRGQTMQGKRAADDTTRGLSSRRQKIVEPTRAGVCLRQPRRASVAIAPGEGGVGTYRC
jgi:hypothetical protein